ncbi:MAG TPA: helix-turn-helix domain-containing protein [Pseudolabrys sp.]|nr:helix-turn-helix domain-containing protein [Pseudolabrys sp.]
MDTNETLLKAILAMVARTAFPTAEIYKIVAPTARSEKQLAAYNLCDGNTPQAEIGKRTGIDKGGLSKLISRWVESGIVVRIGKDQHPMHVYPISTNPKPSER